MENEAYLGDLLLINFLYTVLGRIDSGEVGAARGLILDKIEELEKEI